jgi:endonuclease YncB( thermonuclease family)
MHAALAIFFLAAAADLSGPARVLDGDTLDVAGQHVRLYGIDAPEVGQLCSRRGMAWACGAAATELLRELIGEQHVACRTLEREPDGRIIGKCKVDWLDLGAEMVTRGFAIAVLQISRDYLQNYREARGKENGIFAGIFVEPAKWRRGERLEVEIENSDGTAACRIKGLRGPDGGQTYYVPEHAAYEEAAVDATRGDRWFCSAQEADDAGWRPATE